MNRISLKELKEALNKIDDNDKLGRFYITHKMTGFEDPEPEIDVVYFADVDEHGELDEMYDLKPMKTIQRFAKDLWIDSKKAVAGLIDEETFESYTEQDYP